MNKLKFSAALGLSLAILIGLNSTVALGQNLTNIAQNQGTPENNVSETIETTPEEPSPSANPLIITNLSRIGIQTGQTLPLTLNEAIRRALENNNEIEVAKNDVKIAEQSLRSLLGFYDPVFTVNPEYSNNVQPQTSTLGGADLSGVTRSNSFRADSTFIQPIKHGGGNVRVFFNNLRNKTSSTFSQLNPTYLTNLGLSFTQPLLRDRKVDFSRQQIRIQRKRVAQSDADFRRTTIEIIAQVQTAYWNLVFALRDQQNRLANLNLSKENLRQIEAKIQAGASAPLARAEIATELANRESDLLLASQQVSIAENVLKRLLLRESDSPDWSLQYVPTDQPVYSDDPVDLNSVLEDAITNRPELSRLKLQREINEIDIEFYRNQIRPQLDLTTSYTMIGLSGAAVGSTADRIFPLVSGNPLTNADAFLLQQIQNLTPTPIIIPDVTSSSSIPPQFVGGYGKSLQNLLRNDTRSFTVGVTLSFPLRNTTANANLARAEFETSRLEAQTRSQEQLIIVEVRNAVQAVETSRLRVLTARRARENAEIQLDGERKLFEVGRSTNFLIFQRENTLTNARNAEIRAETDYNKALSDLQKATSTTLLSNNIRYESPIDDN